jgi:hypothetical protein
VKDNAKFFQIMKGLFSHGQLGRRQPAGAGGQRRASVDDMVVGEVLGLRPRGRGWRVEKRKFVD